MPILPRITAATATKIDQELMGSHGFSIDQLMELAGLAVADCMYNVHPPSKGANVLVLAGPGNNGGDGLVASRHLFLRGYRPLIYYPKPSKGTLYDNLQTQLKQLGLAQISGEDELRRAFGSTDFIIDSLFGFSFKPPVREQFVPVMELLSTTAKPVLAVDIPSSWNVDSGPLEGSSYAPPYLISLTAPKTCADHFRGTHFVGGRFISQQFAKSHGFEVPPFEGVSHVWQETE